MRIRSPVQLELIAMRKRLRLTQSALGHVMGFGQITVAHWESDRPPSGKSLVALVEFAYFRKDEAAPIFFRELFRCCVPLPAVTPLVWNVNAGIKGLGEDV